jgi:AcrR family transcriptional regulator
LQSQAHFGIDVTNRNVRYGAGENLSDHLTQDLERAQPAQGGEGGGELTERQKDVLNAVLRLLVEEGDRLTMTAVARRASCSKETLYKWFGDRDGLLTATVQWQASKVRVASVDRARLDMVSLTASLERFAADWLSVISSETSIALNRVAVAHAGSDKRDLGAIVLENGRLAMGRRLKPVLLAGQEKGLLAFEHAEEAFRTFFGLVARDVQIRLLLGDRLELTDVAIGQDAAQATRQFLALYGA